MNRVARHSLSCQQTTNHHHPPMSYLPVIAVVDDEIVRASHGLTDLVSRPTIVSIGCGLVEVISMLTRLRRSRHAMECQSQHPPATDWMLMAML